MISTHKPRVLLVIDSLSAGGAERVAVDIANSLDHQRYEVRLCSTRTDGPLHDNVIPSVAVRVLGRRATWDLPKLVEFARLVRSEEIDLVHSHGRGTLKFVALSQALRLIRVRHLFHDHYGMGGVDHSADLGLRAAMRQIDAYVGVDARLCEWASTTCKVPTDHVNLIRSGVDVDRFGNAAIIDIRTELNLPRESVLFAMVANFRSQKDHLTLFRAIADLPERAREQFQLVILGNTLADSDQYARSVAMLDRLHLNDRVHLLGERNDVPEILNCADAGVLSSLNETGPLAILEYMASGLPFAATDTGEIAGAVRDLNVGFLTPPGDHHALAGSLLSLIEMSEIRRQEMGERGRSEVGSRFSQKMAIRQIQRVYDDLLGLTTSQPG